MTRHLSAAAEHERRLGVVAVWLKRNYTPGLTIIGPYIADAMRMWYPNRESRARALVLKAIDLYKGLPVKHAGRPRNERCATCGQRLPKAKRNEVTK